MWYQWFEQSQKRKECNETWCKAPAGIRTESPRNCTTVQPWTACSSSSRWRSFRLKYQPGSRMGSWSAGISTPCSFATCHVQIYTNFELNAQHYPQKYEINSIKLPCARTKGHTLRERERESASLHWCTILFQDQRNQIKITLCRNSLIFSPSLLV